MGCAGLSKPTMSAPRPSHAKLSFGQRVWRRSRWVVYVVGGLVILLVAARIAMPYAIKEAINRRLEKIPEYSGWVDNVGVSLYRGGYTIDGLVVQKRNGAVKEPFVRAEHIDFSIAWRELFHGKLVSDIDIIRPSITFVDAPSATTSQMETDHRWQDVIQDIFPIDITNLRIRDGQLRYINEGMKPKVDLRVAHMEALATGLRNRQDEAKEEFPAKITVSGETIGTGKLAINADLEPLALSPHFLLKLQVESVAMPALNDFLRAYANVDVSAGTFNGYVEMTARNGKYNGYFKPFFENVDFRERPGDKTPFGQEIWETVVRGFAWVFKNHKKDDVATRVPFQGEFGTTSVGTWETIKTLVRHAFIEPLQHKLDSKPGPENTPAKKVPKSAKAEGS